MSGCLVKPIGRAIDWTPFAVAVPAVLGLAFAAGGEPVSLAATVRLGALLPGTAAGFAVVDPLSVVTPVPRWVRQWLRTLLAFAAAAAAWCAVFGVFAVRAAPGTVTGFGGYALEAAVCVSAGLACTAVVAVRRADRVSGAVGAAVLLALAASTLFYEGRVWPLPEEPEWAAVHHAWLLVLPVPLMVLTLANGWAERVMGPA
ncbi:hypothetical protein [Amycolatopsis xylanica]|uniref:hypothetical protein n=1 Tax=Amycolatopsis xylanica TaxID=589385 RepID=UPI00115F8A86|nr:hypothetical protein [Amycolatopsis xylanica]